MPALERWGARLHVRCRVSPWASSSPCWGVTPEQPGLLELSLAGPVQFAVHRGQGGAAAGLPGQPVRRGVEISLGLGPRPVKERAKACLSRLWLPAERPWEFVLELWPSQQLHMPRSSGLGGVAPVASKGQPGRGRSPRSLPGFERSPCRFWRSLRESGCRAPQVLASVLGGAFAGFALCSLSGEEGMWPAASS